MRNLLLVLLLNLFIGARVANVDNVAHVGGFLAGVVAMALLEAVPPRRRALQVAALATPFVAGAVLLLVAFGSVPAGPSCAGV